MTTNPNTLYRKRRDLLVAQGCWQPSIIPADHVADHLRNLVAAGRTPRWIARRAGISHGVVYRLLNGRSTRIARHNAEKILAVTRADQPARHSEPDTWIPAAGTRRRLEALACMGWGNTDISREIGVHWQTLSNLRSGQPRVSALVAARVARVYGRLSRVRREDRAGRWVRSWARNRGFAPPAAWTKWTIDDPNAGPLPLKFDGDAV